jgi:phage gp45-like
MELMNRAIARALNRVKLPFAAAVKSSTSALLYTLSGALSREDRKNIEAMQHYGLVSRLPAGTRVIVIPRMGATEKLVIVSEAHQTALSLSEGDVALERATGEVVHLKDGSIEVIADTVTVIADTVNLGATGGKALVNEDLIPLYNAHTHPHGDPAGVTGVPAVPAALQKTIKTKAV